MIVPKRQFQELVSLAFVNLAPKKKNLIECPVCKKLKCYEHCNNCGISIYFKKNDWDRWVCMEAGTEVYHRCMQQGTKSGKFLDVNNKSNVGNFWRDNIVQESDNSLVKKIKQDRYAKLTGYGYVESLKEEKNLWLDQRWGEFTFQHGK